MPSYYLDTNIWLDIHEQRGSNSDTATTFLRDALTSDAIFSGPHSPLQNSNGSTTHSTNNTPSSPSYPHQDASPYQSHDTTYAQHVDSYDNGMFQFTTHFTHYSRKNTLRLSSHGTGISCGF